MKRILLTCLLAITTQGFAQVPEIYIEKFSGGYQNEIGSATAEAFKFADSELQKNASFAMFKQAGSFVLRSENTGEEVILEGIPESVNELQNVSFTDIDLKVDQKQIDISIPKLKGEATENRRLDIEDFTLNCSGDLSGDNAKLAVLKTCFEDSGRVNLANFATEKNKMRNLYVDVKDKKLYFSAKVGGMTARGWGASEYRESENKIILRVDKVKVKFLSVTGRFFRELESEPNENVVINRPYIEILLD